MPFWLLALLWAAFVLYTDDYVIAGLLPEIAADLGVSHAVAGQLVTAFSLTVAVAAPAGSVLFARVPRRLLLAAALAGFVLANVAAAAAPGFGWLVGCRVAAACAAGTATPVLFATALQRAPQGRAGRYVAVVAFGVTGSIALGVPIGTLIGGQWGWRGTFVAMAAAGATAGMLLIMALGADRPDEHRRLGDLLDLLPVLATPLIVRGLLANLTLMTGSMMMLTYLAPFLAGATGAGLDARAVAFGLAGLAGMAGIWAGGVATDRWGTTRTLTVGVASVVVSMAVLWVLWLLRPVPVTVVFPALVVWAAASFWNSPAIQARLAALAGPATPQALALNTSGTYLGVSAAAALGGVVLELTTPGLLAPTAALLGLLALALVATARSRAVAGDRAHVR